MKRPWIPAFAGMTSKGNSKVDPSFAGMMSNGEAHRGRVMSGESVKSPWIPAFAGMTSQSNSDMDPCFRRDDEQLREPRN